MTLKRVLRSSQEHTKTSTSANSQSLRQRWEVVPRLRSSMTLRGWLIWNVSRKKPKLQRCKRRIVLEWRALRYRCCSTRLLQVKRWSSRVATLDRHGTSTRGSTRQLSRTMILPRLLSLNRSSSRAKSWRLSSRGSKISRRRPRLRWLTLSQQTKDAVAAALLSVWRASLHYAPLLTKLKASWAVKTPPKAADSEITLILLCLLVVKALIEPNSINMSILTAWMLSDPYTESGLITYSIFTL